jgi:hypothetical protein
MVISLGSDKNSESRVKFVLQTIALEIGFISGKCIHVRSSMIHVVVLTSLEGRAYATDVVSSVISEISIIIRHITSLLVWIWVVIWRRKSALIRKKSPFATRKSVPITMH